MENLIIEQTRIPYNRSGWRSTKTYMRLFVATYERGITSYSGTGTTEQQAVRDLGHTMLHTTGLNDEIGRLFQGLKYSQVLSTTSPP